MREKNHLQYVLVVFTLCLCFLLPFATISAALDICDECSVSNPCGQDKDCWEFEDGIFRCVPTGQGKGYECAADDGGGCFIATAAFGSMMEPHVKILRSFRDRILLQNSIGKGFVGLYYTYSPPIADFIAKHDSMKAFIRISLLPVVGMSWVALKIGPITTMAIILFFSISMVGLVRIRRKKVKN
ncbi:MAG: hypothetical protein JRJ33_06200 [Deltaproteobacteria bacterium]|nr:hypothetical protein [Deltaproteobacteria bacterium]